MTVVAGICPCVSSDMQLHTQLGQGACIQERERGGLHDKLDSCSQSQVQYQSPDLMEDWQGHLLLVHISQNPRP